MTFTCPRCLQELDYIPDGCRDPQCPRDTLEILEMSAMTSADVQRTFDQWLEEQSA